MKNLIDSYKKTKKLHHIYALEGDKKTTISVLFNFFENDLKIKTYANPDFYFNNFISFGIDDARELQTQSFRKAVSGELRVFVITFSLITSEAQNALLKLFEEPPRGTHFFIITTSLEIFLPTIKSRFHTLKLEKNDGDNKFISDKFIRLSKPERIKFLEDIIENKDKERALEFLNDLEITLYKNWRKNYSENQNKYTGLFEMIQKYRGYIRGRAPSVKMILESIALSV
ncbi:hypothetical protein COT82_00585 [Candidatus Campbellbacteria bacterium CG10_big_fil_rev_8_21_14_0_10_35_52]|uniref:DNA polymerase III subunit delta n=1 Tax=Candidatus Campbellbacteria bacterium CG10_big_fil_rev_8_21_14_0_10_35_52 TaxID=1974527 RepID=A0A2M6WVT5_9BACT|nr:MAG: hypothetical protein COT82_00585 [Candidatus Campbellbacteria bacterium CG10_big_fil_rev_8_21_14_0_10_35_52]